MPNKSKLEDELRYQIKAAGLPKPLEQKRLIPGRRYAWDFCWEIGELRLACEVQGGLWLPKGGHTSGTGVTRDCEKMCLATLAGWWTMSFAPDHIHSGQALRWIQEFLGRTHE